MAELDPNKFSVGDVFYGVKDSINAYHRKKIMRVIDGEDWFKYDMPPVTYKLVTYEVLGILTKTLDGEWEHNSEYELQPEIYVSSDADPKVTRYTMYVNDMDCSKYFLDKDEALAHIETLCAKSKEMDRA